MLQDPHDVELTQGQDTIGVFQRDRDVMSGQRARERELVGHVDADGVVYTGTRSWNRERVGRVDTEGVIYAGARAMRDERVGEVDAGGRVLSGTGFRAREIGRVAPPNRFAGAALLLILDGTPRLTDSLNYSQPRSPSSETGTVGAFAAGVAAGLGVRRHKSEPRRASTPVPPEAGQASAVSPSMPAPTKAEPAPQLSAEDVEAVLRRIVALGVPSDTVRSALEAGELRTENAPLALWWTLVEVVALQAGLLDPDQTPQPPPPPLGWMAGGWRALPDPESWVSEAAPMTANRQAAAVRATVAENSATPDRGVLGTPENPIEVAEAEAKIRIPEVLECEIVDYDLMSPGRYNGMELEPHGSVVVLRLALTNFTKEPVKFESGAVHLLGRDGSVYGTSAGAGEKQIFLLGGRSLIGREFQPGSTEVGELLFDVPSARLKSIAQVRIARAWHVGFQPSFAHIALPDTRPLKDAMRPPVASMTPEEQPGSSGPWKSPASAPTSPRGPEKDEANPSPTADGTSNVLHGGPPTDTNRLTAEALVDRLRRSALDADELPSGHQLELLLACANLYARHSLLDGPLCKICRNKDACWRTIATADRPHGDRGHLSLPWVGPDYRPGGVAVLGMNLNDCDGLAKGLELVHWERTDLRDHKRKVLAHEGYRGSLFQYGSLRSASVLLDVVAGRPATDRAEPSQLIETLDSTVRLQAVKCSPASRPNAAPAPAMWRHCPEMLLEDELRILRPSFLLAFGQENQAAIDARPGYRFLGNGDHLTWGRWTLDAELDVTVCFLAHPMSSTKWSAGHTTLLSVAQRLRNAAEA